MVKVKVGDKSKVKPKTEPRRVRARNMAGGSSRKQTSVPNNGCFYDCGELISEETKALQCERCVIETWKCTACFGISDDMYDSSSKVCFLLYRF